MKNNVYISCPISISMNTLIGVGKAISQKGYKVSYWERVNYDPYMLLNSNYVVFILPDFGFEEYIDDLPRGLKSELKTAIDNNIKILLAYKTKSGEINVYNAEIQKSSEYPTRISGIPGTSNYLKTITTKENLSPLQIIVDKTNNDRRLLLK